MIDLKPQADILIKSLKMQTPFADRLHTNYVPLDPEIKQIHRIISRPLEEISRLDGKIAYLQSMLDDLHGERDLLSIFVDAHRALLSGIRRLPRELLQEIFTYCLPSSRRASSSIISCEEAPILLGRICSSWRQIVMSTPQLWSSIHVSLPGSTNRVRVLQRVKAVERLLELSGTCPLSISFSCSGNSISAVEEAASSLFQVLSPSSQRWETLNLILPPFLFSKFFMTFTEADFPLLNSIRLAPGLCMVRSGLLKSCGAMFRAPSLRSLSVSKLDISLSFADCNHITDLNLDHMHALTTPEAIKILSSCPNLIFCRLKYLKALGTRFSAISLPFLRSLDIAGEPGDSETSDLTDFFDALIVPSLREFACNSYTRSGAGVPFKSMVSQSPVVENIKLCLNSLSTAAECLPLLPSLKQMSIYLPICREKPLGECLLEDDLLRLLTPSLDSGECLCPHLQEIKFYNWLAITDDAVRIFLMMRTSHPTVARLKNATFTFCRPQTSNIMPELELLDGLSVDIRYYTFD